jgi:hypothetical protein
VKPRSRSTPAESQNDAVAAPPVTLPNNEDVKHDLDVIMAAARDYARRGFSVIPIGHNKKPTTAWSTSMLTRAKVEEIDGWFGRQRGLTGVGIVLGAVSGGLYARDFDRAESYQNWAGAHPDLAQRLPTVRTARGFHVYARWNGIGTGKFDDGELRGEKAYVVAPPSPHASGSVYHWIVPLPDGAVPEADPREAHLDQSWRETERRAIERTERIEKQRGGEHREAEETEETEEAEEIEAMVAAAVHENDSRIEDVIRRTIPKEPGGRNNHVFKFARALKALPVIGTVNSKNVRLLKDVVRVWWKRAAPHMITKDFGSTWGDFVHAWSRVRFAEGADVLGAALERATAAPPPPWCEEYGYKCQLLAALCRELQRSAGPDAPFFLSCKKASECVGVDQSTAYRWFDAFVADGALILVQKGNSAKASRWRYVGEDLRY